jgi:arginine decarboxylase
MLRFDETARRWTISDAADLYEVAHWGKGYFSINGQGHVCVHPTKDPARSIDLKQLIARLRVRGMQPPVLVRFAGILEHRLGEIRAAFRQAIEEHNYQAGYHCLYPIKVNQQRQVVEEVLHFGGPYQFGLEAGSKPELLAVIAMASNETPIVGNGFKDEKFVEMALLAQKIGRQVFVVVEKYTDLGLLVRLAKQVGVRPNIGIRLKLASRASGRWQGTSGYRAKFGLLADEMLRALAELKAHGMEDCLKLLHFHIGTQVNNIRHIKAALNEAARIYVDLVRQGAGLRYLDVGGGLGVDYDGSQTNFESSVNYTLQEYANDVVYHVQTVCDDAGVPHPTIFSESGRAVVAYNSVLVFNVLGVSELADNGVPQKLPDDAEQPLVDLWDTYQRLNGRNMLECFHDAQQALDTAMSLFGAGYLPLVERAQAESLFWAICRKIDKLARQLDYVPEDLEGLDAMLSETYFCNFSLFQSLPDSWAIKQLFPILPIHRLHERPTHAAVLADITCDSDGKIDRFIDRRDVKRTLRLHSYDGGPYYLGAFLIGAYQEILGDLHNLFGDTNAVHVSLGPDNEVIVETMINGDSVREVLEYVEFDTPSLVNRLRTAVDQAIRDSRIDDHQAGRLLRFYQAGLEGSTYLEDGGEAPKDSGLGVQGSGFRVQGSGVGVQGAAVGAQGSGESPGAKVRDSASAPGNGK